MRIQLAVDGQQHEVDLARYTASATLAELILAATGQPADDDLTYWVDDRKAQAADRLADTVLIEGSRIGVAKALPVEPIRGWSATLSGGLHAGRVVPVPANRPLLVGRSPQADIVLDSPSASWKHLTIGLDGDGVRVADAGSTNGTLVDGEPVDPDGILIAKDAVVTAGGATITVRAELDETPAPRPGSLHNLTPAGTAPFNRPPRPGRPPEPQPVIAPQRKDLSPTSKFSFLTILGPLVLAFAMVLVMGDLRYAAISALSPLLGVATWFEQKHRRSKELIEENKRFDAALDTLRADLATAAIEERARMRDDLPDPAMTARRAAIPTTQLWQRRHGTPGFLAVQAGVGDIPWNPPLDRHGISRLDDRVRDLVQASRVPSAPVEVDLSNAGVVGIVGDRDSALAVARSLLVQAAVHCGPADLTIVTCCDPGREPAWAWAGWLPHVRRLDTSAGERWTSAERARSDALLRTLRDNIETHPTPAVLLVLDTDVLLEGREAPARTLLGRGRRTTTTSVSNQRPETQVAGIVVAAAEEQLPASCTVVIHAQPDAAGQVTRPTDRSQVDDVILAGIDTDTAQQTATHLSRFDDPDLIVPGAALPSLVRLPPLLGVDQLTAAAISKLWTGSRRVSTPIGIGEKGTFELDIVRDGPHGLVGGTTGSGKSEFLRSLVAGLAARNDPTKLSFILIDFKGGAAFKPCERLPHTIGTVSNLDEQLADRALRALEAEMDYRQRTFAAAGEGIDNLDAYLATNPAEPMPRLLLVVDEFAMLAKDFPDVLSSLVAVGAVGRTLGVHMILATQRPAGVVNDDILANTNLRVALRVQSKDDSINVIGVPAASAIGRTQRGRAFVKLGQDEIVPIQTALVTGRAEAAGQEPVHLLPVTFGAPPAPPPVQTVDESDLDQLIDAIIEANAAAGIAPPRQVWPEALGARVNLDGFPADPTAPTVSTQPGPQLTIGLSDDPDHQRQLPAVWDRRRGNLLLVGIPGSGTTTTLATIALAATANTPPDQLDLLILDLGSRDLAPLADLPHTIGYVGSGTAAREQQVRLLKHIHAEFDRRRATPGPHRPTIVLIDGLATLRDEYSDYDGLELLDRLYRAWADGPEVNLWFAAATTRARLIPSAIDEVTTQKWLFRLTDQYDYAAAGIRSAKQIPAAVPGRCVLAESRLQTHIATPARSLPDAVAQVTEQWTAAPAKSSVVRQLPENVTVAELDTHAVTDGEPWRIPVGLAEADLEPAYLELYEGEHVLVAGPARSGKSTALLAIAEVLQTAANPPQVWAVHNRRSPLASAPASVVQRRVTDEDDLSALAASARMHPGPVVILIDDAEKIEDNSQVLTGLMDASLSNLHLIAAGRADDLRSLYSHWTKRLRKARCGILLQPSIDYDGDLLGITIPRTAPVAITPGRGYACNSGQAQLIHCAEPRTREPEGVDPTTS